MQSDQRKIYLHTPTKMYSGNIDLGSQSLRTIDVFNSANVYWKDPAERSFDDALLLHDAAVVLEGGTKIGSFDSIQVKLSDVFFFYDTMDNLGDSNERKRAEMLKGKTKEQATTVRIITKTRGNAFFHIQGVFYGLFKSKTKQRFIPIPESTVTAVIHENGKWLKRRIEIGNNFVGVSVSHIEACTFAPK